MDKEISEKIQITTKELRATGDSMSRLRAFCSFSNLASEMKRHAESGHVTYTTNISKTYIQYLSDYLEGSEIKFDIEDATDSYDEGSYVVNFSW